VIEGKIHFSIENGSTELVEKQIISIHAGIMHTIKALEDSLIMITTKGA
jgi:quercetin dioxygenase-like cupin family protein